MNTVYNTEPLILHGNGYSKESLNSLGNYLANAWSPEEGCIMCWEGTIELNKTIPKSYPIILIAIFIERPTPFLNEFLTTIYQQDYPKSKLHLFVHNNVEYHQDVVNSFMKNFGYEYNTSKLVFVNDAMNEVDARNLAMYVLKTYLSKLFYIKHFYILR